MNDRLTASRSDDAPAALPPGNAGMVVAEVQRVLRLLVALLLVTAMVILLLHGLNLL